MVAVDIQEAASVVIVSGIGTIPAITSRRADNQHEGRIARALTGQQPKIPSVFGGGWTWGG